MDTTLDVSGDLAGAYIKRTDLDHDLAFTIAAVTRETFEPRGGRPAQTRIVLTSTTNPPRKFSCNKVNLRTLSTAWGKLASAWIGKTCWIHFDPSIEIGGQVVGGMRIRIPAQQTATPSPAPSVANVRKLEEEIRRLKAQVAQVPPRSREPGEDDDDISTTMVSLDAGENGGDDDAPF